jgi:hypothetical protein
MASSSAADKVESLASPQSLPDEDSKLRSTTSKVQYKTIELARVDTNLTAVSVQLSSQPTFRIQTAKYS